MHSLNAESTKAQELKQVVEKELKKVRKDHQYEEEKYYLSLSLSLSTPQIAAGIQSAGLELKSAT